MSMERTTRGGEKGVSLLEESAPRRCFCSDFCLVQIFSSSLTDLTTVDAPVIEKLPLLCSPMQGERGRDKRVQKNTMQ